MQKYVISWGNFGHKLVKHEPNKFFREKFVCQLRIFDEGTFLSVQENIWFLGTYI